MSLFKKYDWWSIDDELQLYRVTGLSECGS